MPVIVLPELTRNPAAVLGEGDLAICNPVELLNGSVALLLFQVERSSTPEPFEVQLEERKADFALVFQSVAAVDQAIAALAEVRDVLGYLQAGRLDRLVVEPTAKAGRFLSTARLRRELSSLIGSDSISHPSLGDVIPVTRIRRLLDALTGEQR